MQRAGICATDNEPKGDSRSIFGLLVQLYWRLKLAGRPPTVYENIRRIEVYRVKGVSGEVACCVFGSNTPRRWLTIGWRPDASPPQSYAYYRK